VNVLIENARYGHSKGPLVPSPSYPAAASAPALRPVALDLQVGETPSRLEGASLSSLGVHTNRSFRFVVQIWTMYGPAQQGAMI
jgi:hypothetical protein